MIVMENTEAGDLSHSEFFNMANQNRAATFRGNTGPRGEHAGNAPEQKGWLRGASS